MSSGAIQQRQAGVTKEDVDPAIVQIPPVREEDVDAMAAIDSMLFGPSRREY